MMLKRASIAFALWAAAAGAAQISVVDGSGATITLPAVARRIVSLAPHATELLFESGAGGRVVGAIDPVDWPREAASLPRVGDVRGLDLERIVLLQPDLAVAWPYSNPAQVERLRSLGIAIYMTDAHDPEAIARDIERLGILSDSAAVARRAAAEFRRRVAALRARPRAVPALRVFYEVWNQPLYTVGGSHLINDAIELCGAANVFASLALPAPSVSVEAVLAAAPEAVVAGSDGGVRPPWLDDWRRWKDLPAVSHDNLLVVDANLLHRPGPRFVAGVEQLCAVLDQARLNSRFLSTGARP